MRILLSVTIKGDIEYCKSLSKCIKNCLEENNHDVDIIVCSEEDFSEEEEKIFKLAIENANDYELVTPLYNFIHDNQMTKALISEPSQEYLILL